MSEYRELLEALKSTEVLYQLARALDCIDVTNAFGESLSGAVIVKNLLDMATIS